MPTSRERAGVLAAGYSVSWSGHLGGDCTATQPDYELSLADRTSGRAGNCAGSRIQPDARHTRGAHEAP